jgi:hypothetical protein
MQHCSSSSPHKAWSLLRYTSLGLLLIIVSACHRAPNLIPAGYEETFTDKARASTAARVDYPVIVLVDRKDTYITFRVTKNGERTWFWEDGYWDLPSWWKPFTWYRIGLIREGEEKPLCNKWTTPNTTVDVTEVRCDFDVNSHLSIPLLGLLFYAVGSDEKYPPADNDPTNGVVSRIYYLMPRE